MADIFLRAVSCSPPFQGGRCPLPFTPRPPSPPPVVVMFIKMLLFFFMIVMQNMLMIYTDTTSQPQRRSSQTCLPWSSQVIQIRQVCWCSLFIFYSISISFDSIPAEQNLDVKLNLPTHSNSNGEPSYIRVKQISNLL